jgi:trans-aconitate methyltransferase
VAREQRLVFGEDAALYDRARPSYPQPLVDDLIEFVGPGAMTADVGCGTGKATMLLAASGLRGVGVEAHPDMAAIAARHVQEYPTWRIDVAAFEEWKPRAGDQPFDLITSAQAWHWIDPAVRFHKAFSLLRPGGWLALFWNRPTVSDAPIEEALDALYRHHAPDMKQRGMGINGRPAFEAVTDPAFETPILRGYEWSRTYSAQEWVDLLATQSDHRLLEPAQRAALLDDVRALIDAHGAYVHPYTCWLWAARKPL